MVAHVKHRSLVCTRLRACRLRDSRGDDDQPDPATAHLEVVIDTPSLHWADGVAETSSVHAISVDDTDGTRTDVTDQATFVVSPVELGGVDDATLAPSGQMAGAGQLTATLSTLLGEGDFQVFISDTVPGTADSSATLFGARRSIPRRRSNSRIRRRVR